MKKRVFVIFLSCFLFILAGYVSAVYYPNMKTDDPDCTNYLRDNKDLCQISFISKENYPVAVDVQMVNILDKFSCDFSLCDNRNDENKQAICYCGLGHCCDLNPDTDKDGFCKKGFKITNAVLCPKESGNIGTDCDDERAAVNTKAKEDCKNGMDDNCDGLKDCEDSDCSADFACSNTLDFDKDGFCKLGFKITDYKQCQSEAGNIGTDCDDGRAAAHPGTSENCANKIDDNCNGKVDCEDTACLDSSGCGDITGVKVSLDFSARTTFPGDGLTAYERKRGESPFSKSTSKVIDLKQYDSEAAVSDESCNPVGLIDDYTDVNVFNYCYKEGDPAKRYENGLDVSGNFWEETAVEFRLLKSSQNADIKLVGEGWYSVPVGYSPYGDSAGNRFTLPLGILSLCVDEHAMPRSFIGNTMTIDTGMDTYDYEAVRPSEIGTARIDLTFRNNLDDNDNGVIDLCEEAQPDISGCSADKMERTIVVNVKSIGHEIEGKIYKLTLDSSATSKYFPYKYYDENITITLAYYFNYGPPGPKLRTRITVADRKRGITYINIFEGHILAGHYTVSEGEIRTDNTLRVGIGASPFDFDILERPCGRTAQKSEQLVLKSGSTEIPIPVGVVYLNSYDKSIGGSVTGVSKWVYGRIGEAYGCFEVVYKKAGQTAEMLTNSVELVSILEPNTNVNQNKQTISGDKSDTKIEIIQKAKGSLDESVFAKTSKTKEACEGWAEYSSTVLSDGIFKISVPGEILSGQDKNKERYVKAKIGDESKCVKVTQNVLPNSKTLNPSPVACDVNLENVFKVDEVTSEGNIIIKNTETPPGCNGVEVGYGVIPGSKERTDAIEGKAYESEASYALRFLTDFELGLTRGTISANKAIDASKRISAPKKLEKVAAKTYDTKEKCEGPKVFVNWYPGMPFFDFGMSGGLMSDIKAYIKKNYQGDVFDRRIWLIIFEIRIKDMYQFVKDNLNFETTSTKKSASISFGWSSGGKDAYENVLNTYSELQKLYSGKTMPPIVLGMFRFDPTESHFNEATLPDMIPYYVDVIHAPGLSAVVSGHDRKCSDSDLGVKGICFDLQALGISVSHHGVSQPIVKSLFRIYVDCLVNSKTKSECESLMTQAINEHKSITSSANEILKKNYLTGAKFSEAEQSDFNSYLAISEKQYLSENSYKIFAGGLYGVNSQNKKEAIHNILLSSKDILDNLENPVI